MSEVKDDVAVEEAKADESAPGGCPMHREPGVYASTDLTYNDYLKVPELLALQIPQSDPAHHDELLFIVIHQAYELWFKLVLHEIDQAIGFMSQGEPLRAHHFLKRVGEIMKLMVSQIHILETMTPMDFLEFRDRLNPASGFQSLQFREVEFRAGLKDERYFVHFKNRPDMLGTLRQRMAEPDLCTSFFEMLEKLGHVLPKEAEARQKAVLAVLKKIYERPHENLPTYLLCESLLDFDEYLGLWRLHHVRVVERIIGFRKGTGGSSGVEYLQSTTTKKCFPFLWDVRTLLEKQ